MIGASGYCFGGSVVLDMARAGPGLKGVAAFQAGLGAAGSPAAAGKVKAKVLALNGGDDPFITPESIDAFKKEMTAAKVHYRYPIIRARCMRSPIRRPPRRAGSST